MNSAVQDLHDRFPHRLSPDELSLLGQAGRATDVRPADAHHGHDEALTAPAVLGERHLLRDDASWDV